MAELIVLAVKSCMYACVLTTISQTVTTTRGDL